MSIGSIDTAEKQWDARTITISTDFKPTWGLSPEAISVAYEILKQHGIVVNSFETDRLSFNNLKTIVSLLGDKYDTSNLSLALQQAIADQYQHWKFKEKWILIVGTGETKLTREELLMGRAIGKILAAEGYGLITGSWPGIDSTVTHTFLEQITSYRISRSDCLIQILVGDQSPISSYGSIVNVSSDMQWYQAACQRAAAIIMIGGKGGTLQTYQQALQEAIPIIPILATGGDAKIAYREIAKEELPFMPAEFQKNQPTSIATDQDADELANQIINVLNNAEKYWFMASSVIQHKSITYNDVVESFGPFLKSREVHELSLPARYKLGTFLVTNQFYYEFIKDDGYRNIIFWNEISKNTLDNFVCKDHNSYGPSQWESSSKPPLNFAHHPVSGICYYEALAFCNWLQSKHPLTDGWNWCLPTEDMWEFAARTEEGRRYPWGFEFGQDRCNSLESGLGETSNVFVYKNGKSQAGCFDMAGNVWELVEAYAHDHDPKPFCVLRGGSFQNNKNEVSSILQLISVPKTHRAPDFGFRVAQVRTSTIKQ